MCVCNSVRFRIQVSVMCVYNRECMLNSVKLRVEVSVICVYIIGSVCVTGNVWFIVDNILCSEA